MHITLFKSLPEDIIDIIWNMLDDNVKSSLDKRYFFSYNFDHYSTMTLHSQYAYNRVMIRNDDSFIFNNIISNYGRKWMSNKKFVDYNNQVHSNYLYFLLSLIHESNASRCNEIMATFLDKEGLSKNLYKKYRIKNIRWSN
jgi:hypothetical protein